MKNVSIFAGILLIAVSGVTCHEEEWPENMKQILGTCMKKLGVSEEDHMEAMKNHDFSNPKLHCMSECMMTESGMLKGTEIKVEKLEEIMHDIGVDMSTEDVHKMHEKCKAAAEQKEDKCDLAREYETCSMETVHAAMQAKKN